MKQKREECSRREMDEAEERGMKRKRGERIG
jgi:hypothetical protein